MESYTAARLDAKSARSPSVPKVTLVPDIVAATIFEATVWEPTAINVLFSTVSYELANESARALKKVTSVPKETEDPEIVATLALP